MTNEHLCALARQGDADAQNLLIENNLRFIKKTAYEVWSAQAELNRSLRISPDDLAQEGSLGLFGCIDSYNPDSGNLFLTYAVRPIGNPEPKEFAISLESQLVLKWVPTNGKWFVGIPFKTLKSHRQSSIREESLWDFLCRTHERTGNIRASRASVSVKEMRFHLLLSAPTIGSHIRSIRYSANLLRHRISDSQLLHRPDCK